MVMKATPVTSPEDILTALDLETETQTFSPILNSLTEEEVSVLALLTEPINQDSIIRALPHTSETTIMLLMRMELEGYIREQNGFFYKV